MAFVAALFLRALHYIYSLVLLSQNLWQRIARTRPSVLLVPRPRLPRHLAVNLLVEPHLDCPELQHCLLECVINAVDWCLALGVENLSIYEEHGTLLKCSQLIRNVLCDREDSDESSSESEIQYPPTPPLSDYSGSWPISPQRTLELDAHTITIHPSNKNIRDSRRSDIKRRKERATSHDSQQHIKLCLLSRGSAKPFIASVAQSFASTSIPRKSRRRDRHSKNGTHSVTMDALNNLLESDCGLLSPDFMIVHPVSPLPSNQPLELHGFPPWHMRLTEIYYDKGRRPLIALTSPSSPQFVTLDEATFNRALDEFSIAEMRFGK